jgi:hypothetical protein
MCWLGRFGFAVFPRWERWMWFEPWHRWNAIRSVRVGPLVVAWSDGD